MALLARNSWGRWWSFRLFGLWRRCCWKRWLEGSALPCASAPCLSRQCSSRVFQRLNWWISAWKASSLIAWVAKRICVLCSQSFGMRSVSSSPPGQAVCAYYYNQYLTEAWVVPVTEESYRRVVHWQPRNLRALYLWFGIVWLFFITSMFREIRLIDQHKMSHGEAKLLLESLGNSTPQQARKQQAAGCGAGPGHVAAAGRGAPKAAAGRRRQRTAQPVTAPRLAAPHLRGSRLSLVTGDTDAWQQQRRRQNYPTAKPWRSA